MIIAIITWAVILCWRYLIHYSVYLHNSPPKLELSLSLAVDEDTCCWLRHEPEVIECEVVEQILCLFSQPRHWLLDSLPWKEEIGPRGLDSPWLQWMLSQLANSELNLTGSGKEIIQELPILPYREKDKPGQINDFPPFKGTWLNLELSVIAWLNVKTKPFLSNRVGL